MLRKLYSYLILYIFMPFADFVMDTKISRNISLIKYLKYATQDVIKDWQLDGLNKLLIHAYSNTCYYKRIFDERGINPYNNMDLNILDRIPILTKKLIVENYNDLIPNNINSIPHIKQSTGGSTGDPLVFLLDKKSWSFSNANTILAWGKVGYNYGDKYIALGSTSLFQNKKKSIKHFIFYKVKNKIGLNGINMSKEVCSKYVKFIQKNNINYIYGYASSIYLLCKFIKENNVQINIKACFPTSEVLTANYRQMITSALSCVIIDSYGAHDGGITAFSHINGYYEVGYNTIVRTIDVKNNIGKILLTDTLNFAMPLINYELGDEIEVNDFLNKEYGYNGQVINKVYGRTSDVIRLDNGNILTGPGFTILFKDLPIEYYQIEQVSGSKLVCKLKKRVNFNTNHELLIISTLKNQAGKGTDVIIEYVEQEELSKSGKRKFFRVD